MSEGNGQKPNLTGNGNGNGYSVGYGKPPLDTRFKPGNKAACNRRGGIRIWKRIQRELMRKKPAEESGQTERRATAVARKFVDKCEGGDIQAIRELIEREEGKVPDRIAGPDGETPIIKILKGVTADEL